MAYTYEIDSTQGIVLVQPKGAAWTPADILDSAKAVVTDDQFSPEYDWIYDLRFVANTIIDSDGLDRLVEQFRRYREEGTVEEDTRSVIVTKDEDVRSTALLYRHKADRPEGTLRIVDTLDEARAWLEIEDGS